MKEKVLEKLEQIKETNRDHYNEVEGCMAALLFLLCCIMVMLFMVMITLWCHGSRLEYIDRNVQKIEMEIDHLDESTYKIKDYD